MKRILSALAIVTCLYGCSKKSNIVTPVKTNKTDTLVIFKYGSPMFQGYLVATDENGKIIAFVKRQTGTSTYVLTTPEEYPKDRINIYDITTPTDPTAGYTVLGYLQVKKGGLYDGSVYPYASANYPLNIHLVNASTFDQLTVSTDVNGRTITSPSDTLYGFKSLYYSDNSKIYTMVTRAGQPRYHFFDITKGAHDLTIDLDQCKSIPAFASLYVSGSSLFGMSVYAKMDKTSNFEYYLGEASTSGNGAGLNYPTEPFQQYSTVVSYYRNNLQYGVSNVGTSIPTQIDSYSATVNFTGSTLADLNINTSGAYDYYEAVFISNSPSVNLYIQYWSPSAANYKNFKLPDFSAYMPKNFLDPTAMRIQDFGLYQADGFNEKNFIYKSIGSYHDVNIKQVQTHY